MLENLRFSNFLGLGWAWSGQSTVKKRRKTRKPIGFPTFLTKKVGKPSIFQEFPRISNFYYVFPTFQLSGGSRARLWAWPGPELAMTEAKC